MVSNDHNSVEEIIVKAIGNVNKILKIDAIVNGESCPGTLIASQILITVMGRIGKELNVVIPDNCYIFHDKKTQAQLTIKEAAIKLIKEAKPKPNKVTEDGN